MCANMKCMCLACGMTQIPVCSTVGACGGVSLFAQIVTLGALSLSLLIGTMNLWLTAVMTKMRKFMKHHTLNI